MIVSTAIQKMIEFYKGNRHDVNHFLKVWAMAKTIGELEGLDRHTQEVLELAAVIHDIACPLCREKYGDTDGKHQELESPALVEAFFTELPAARPDVDRISWLAAHHHTYTDIGRHRPPDPAGGRLSRQRGRAGPFTLRHREFPPARVPHRLGHSPAGQHLSAGLRPPNRL